MEMLKTEYIEGDPPRLQVDGEVDLSTADQLRDALQQVAATDPRAVVDMGGVTFIDVVGLHALLAVAAGRNGAGPLTVLNAPRVAWLLEIVGLSELPSIVLRNDGEADGR